MERKRRVASTRRNSRTAQTIVNPDGERAPARELGTFSFDAAQRNWSLPPNQRALRLPGAPAEFTAARLRRYTSFTFLSGRLRTGLPVAAWIAFITAGVTTQIVGSPTPPQLLALFKARTPST